MIPARKAKLSQVEAERQKLKIIVENQQMKANKLQQMINEANERREVDATKHMETYGRNLHLESSLAAMRRGEPLEEHNRTNTDRATALGEVKKPPVTAFTGPQGDEERLEQRSITTNPGRDEESWKDLVATLETEESQGDLLATLERLKEATAGETTERSNETLSRNVVEFARKIVDSRERLARKEEVLESIISSQYTVPARSISRLPRATISTSRRSSRIPTTADFAQ